MARPLGLIAGLAVLVTTAVTLSACAPAYVPPSGYYAPQAGYNDYSRPYYYNSNPRVPPTPYYGYPYGYRY